MKTVTVSVFFDYKCNFACDHCSVGSSPETVFEMPEEVFDDVFRQAKEIPSIEQFVFTGGEVTLHKDRLVDAIERASAEGFKTRIVTNAWWANDVGAARDMLDDLVGAGLDEINTSYDDYHTEYMDAENIVNCVEASLEYEELRNVVVAMILGEDPAWDEERMLGALDERLDDDPRDISDLKILEDYADPLGRGAQLDSKNYASKADADAGCDDVINTVSVHPDGSVKACCGHAIFYQPDLTLGNVKDEPLEEIISRGSENLVYWLIHEVGPKNLIDMMDVEDEMEYTGICHACNSLFENYREEFIEFVEENREELIREEIFLSDNQQEKFSTLSENKEKIMEQIDQIEGSKPQPGDVRDTA